MPDPYGSANPAVLLLPATRSEAISLASDWSTTDPWTGVIVATDGIIKGQLANDSADRDITVKAGVPYLFRYKSIKSTANGTTATGIVRFGA